MALDAAASGDAMAQEIADQIARSTPLSNEAMAGRLATVYLDHSKKATLPGADVSSGGDISILKSAFEVLDSSLQVDKLATGLCNYWATCGTPGMPAHGGTSVVSVTIPGPAVMAAMKAAIQSLVTTSKVDRPFEKFFSTTDNVVKAIPCIVTEVIPGTPPVPTPFPDFLS